MPLLPMMAHYREWQRSINHTVQYLEDDKKHIFRFKFFFGSFRFSEGFPRLYIADEVLVVLCRLAYQQLSE